MISDELTEYLLRDLDAALKDEYLPIRPSLNYWFSASERFKQFAVKNREKIRSKSKGCNRMYEAVEDVRTELEVGYLLHLNEDYSVVYEKNYGPGRPPDFTVGVGGADEFNVEVKRLRRATLAHRYREWLDELDSKLRLLSPGFIVSMPARWQVGDLDLDEENKLKPGFIANDDPSHLANRLFASKEKIFQFVEDTIRKKRDKQSSGYETFPVPGFELELELLITRWTDPFAPTQLVSNSDISFYTFGEERKLGDLTARAWARWCRA